jgi:hypothetical protein
MSSEDGVPLQKIDGDAMEGNISSHDRAPATRKNSSESAGQNSRQKGDNVNAALRRAYDSTVHEVIPSSMLDLLNKLD